MSTPISPSERSYIISGLTHSTQPTRIDSRSLLQPRPFTISYGDAPQANGSARVIIAGGTEVIAGIRLVVGDVVEGKGKGKEGWRGVVEVDVTPQAYPQLSSQTLQLLGTQYAAIITDHFLSCVPAIPIIPPTKYFIPHLHLTLISAQTASPLPALLYAARAAFSSLQIPKIKRIALESADPNDPTHGGEDDLSGIKAAVRARKGKRRGAAGGGGGGGDDWNLDLEGDGWEYLGGREELPVLVTLHRVPGSEIVFLDATAQEEAACPDKVYMFFTGSGKVCGIRTEGNDALDISRIRPLLLEGKRIASELITSLNAQFPDSTP